VNGPEREEYVMQTTTEENLISFYSLLTSVINIIHQENKKPCDLVQKQECSSPCLGFDEYQKLEQEKRKELQKLAKKYKLSINYEIRCIGRNCDVVAKATKDYHHLHAIISYK
jgi:hypothetical protein